MAEQPLMNVEPREGVGSGDARKIRRQGRIPGILYGHGESEPISVDETEFRHTVHPSHFGSLVVRVRLDGRDAGLALVKSVQVNTLDRKYLNVELQTVSSEERLQVSVPIVLTGEPAGTRVGGVLEQSLHALNLRCSATEVPDELTYDVSALSLGEVVHVSDLELPAGSELLDNPDEVVAVMLEPTVPVQEEPVIVEPGVSGPALTGDKQKDDFPPER